tara:strand:- start:1628 stop:1744 length:117 start_codon:yes stop_codon:yes gene_type:complete
VIHFKAKTFYRKKTGVGFFKEQKAFTFVVQKFIGESTF